MGPDADERRQRAYEAGFAAAVRGEEAAPGCTATNEGHEFLRGYVDGRASLQRDGLTHPRAPAKQLCPSHPAH